MNGISLEGTTALVTGASRGIGQAVARALAGEGVRLHLLARSRDRLEALAEELGGARPLVADLTRVREVRGAVRESRKNLGGPPDLLVSAAGVFDLAPAEETSMEVFDRNLEVNLRGAFRLIRELIPEMLERGRGHLVHVGSVAGRKALPGNVAYSASKFGLRGVHEVLVEELRGTGVRSTLVEPAAVNTSLWDPLDPDGDPHLPDREAMLSPEDVAEAVLFAATRRPGVGVSLLQLEAT